jgi:hypothetical protein
MADTEAETPAPADTTEDEHPTALIGRGESVLVKQMPTDDEESPVDFESEIALIKESQVRQLTTYICAHPSPTFY